MLSVYVDLRLVAGSNIFLIDAYYALLTVIVESIISIAFRK